VHLRHAALQKAMVLPTLRLLLAAALLASVSGSDATSSEPVAVALQQNDECAADDDSEQCALAALQLRGVRAGAAAEAAAFAVDANTSCASNAIGEMVRDMAPACIRACPHLCADALPFLAVKSTAGSKVRDLMCAHAAELKCILQPVNAEACGPLLKELPADWTAMPKSEGGISAACAGKTGTSLLAEGEGSVVAALLARASAGDSTAAQELLDRALTGKWKDERCANAPEGQTCVANSRGGHSNAYIYCSNHKRLSAGETSCPAKRGPMSWCVGGGAGLSHDYCDDPFCRNGGASAGNGLYCHNGMVVKCVGQNAPVTIDACSDSSYSSGNGCTTTDHYQCAGHHPNPHCEFSYSSTACTGSYYR